MKLILIRHGKTEANEKHLYCGSRDLPLSENGRRELDSLIETGSYPDISGYRVITSGMLRCDETLGLLYGSVTHLTDGRLREMDFGKFEMRSYEEMKNVPTYIEWISGDNEKNIAPGGESGEMMRARVLCALDDILADGRDCVIIAHGGVIAAIMAHLFPSEGKNRYEWQPSYGRGYVIDTIAGAYSPVP